MRLELVKDLSKQLDKFYKSLNMSVHAIDEKKAFNELQKAYKLLDNIEFIELQYSLREIHIKYTEFYIVQYYGVDTLSSLEGSILDSDSLGIEDLFDVFVEKYKDVGDWM